MNYTVLAPKGLNYNDILPSPIFLPFAEPIINFINTLSKKILHDNAFKQYPELIAMAFWMRKSHLAKLQNTFDKKRESKIWLPRGKVFHISPSNVDTIFIYSWFLSMLAGNINIIRISSKGSAQLDLLIGVINSLLKENSFESIRRQVMLVQYGHDVEVTAYFSTNCDVRVIWGGDQTIKEIRSIPLKPTATEMTFADKFSLSMIKAKKFLDYSNKDQLIQNFYNDAYWFLQMACSSPKLIAWVGDIRDIEAARHLFWQMLEEKVKHNPPEMYDANAIDKLVSMYALSIEQPARIEPCKTNYINRILLKDHQDLNIDLHCGAGLFYELQVDSLETIIPLISRKYQTVSSFGFSKEEIRYFIEHNILKGIDRVVPIGDALKFSAIWDGYDLLREYCREVEVTI